MKKTMMGIAALAISMSAFADRDPSRLPIDQGIASVTKNIAKNPDNPGLPNALRHQLENQQRQTSRREEVHQRPERVERVERVERPERPERVERVDLAIRSDFGRAHRPDRPQRNGRK